MASLAAATEAGTSQVNTIAITSWFNETSAGRELINEYGLEVAIGAVALYTGYRVSKKLGLGRKVMAKISSLLECASDRIGRGDSFKRGIEQQANRRIRRNKRPTQPSNRAQHERYKDHLRADMERPATSDQKLDGIMNELYRPGASILSGSTADALRYEQITGRLVRNKSHNKKAIEFSDSLCKWLSNNPTASPGDRAAAENALRDLQNAIRGQ